MYKKPSEYTQNMRTIFEGNFSELKSFYCREDFERALAEYDCAKKDAIIFRMKDVSRLCNARGINAKALIADRSILDTIPTRGEMKDKLLQSFYEMYSYAPATTDYMERIVRRLAPEYASDTVRVAILKKFVVGGGETFKKFNTKNILNWAKEQLTKTETAAYKVSSEEERRKLLLSKIDDSIFDYESVKMTDADVLKLIINRITKYQDDDTLTFTGIELSESTRSLLAELISVDEDDIRTNELKGLQDLCVCIEQNPDDVDWSGVSKLVKNLEADFTNQLRIIKRVSRTGKEGTAADLYKQAKKDAVKAKKAAAKKKDIDFELLELCNDLATGNFRVNGKTKVYLYYFAFMFEMTVPLEGRNCEPERDIVKNLFQDYYNDNFLRLLSVDYSDPKNATAIEKEPTGEGINYKSFVEMIYLYFLCRDDLDMTPGEKINKAEVIIKECVERAKKKGQPVLGRSFNHTQVYRDSYVNVLMNKKIDEIADFVLAHYQVLSPDDSNIARIMVASEENTASDLIDEIMKDIDEAYPDIELFNVRQKGSLDKGIKDDIAFSQDTGFDWKVKTLLEEKYSDDEKFLKVVRDIDDRTHIRNGRFNKNERARMLMLLHVLTVHSSEREALSKYKLQSHLQKKGVVSVENQITNAINILMELGFDVCRAGDDYYLGERKYADDILVRLMEKVSKLYYSIDSESELLITTALTSRLRADKRVTRSELIAIHFNYYITLINQTIGLDTFPDVFEDYAATIDPILEEARYQPLSEKNIFDMYIVTALYFYLVENSGDV